MSSEAEKSIKLLCTIFKNILDNPNHDKYRSLNLQKILEKFANNQAYVQLLYDSGFTKTEDGKRLIFDSQYLGKLKKISEQIISVEEKTYNPIHSQYLLAPSNLNSEKKQDIQCEIEECLCLNIITNVLCLYNEFIKDKQKQNQHTTDTTNHNNNIFNKIYARIGNKYNSVDLLNDYNHLLLNHAEKLEYIYNRLKETIYKKKSCILSKCLLMRRNQRNRSGNERYLYFTDDIDHIVEEQLLDRIHCHLLHTYDVGYKLTKKEIDKIIDDDTKVDDDVCTDIIVSRIYKLIKSKRKSFDNVKGLERMRVKNTKFVADDTNKYSYGYRFFYWDYYKNSQNTYDDGNIISIPW
eukprot:526890_1